MSATRASDALLGRRAQVKLALATARRRRSPGGLLQRRCGPRQGTRPALARPQRVNRTIRAPMTSRRLQQAQQRPRAFLASKTACGTSRRPVQRPLARPQLACPARRAQRARQGCSRTPRRAARPPPMARARCRRRKQVRRRAVGGRDRAASPRDGLPRCRSAWQSARRACEPRAGAAAARRRTLPGPRLLPRPARRPVSISAPASVQGRRQPPRRLEARCMLPAKSAPHGAA